MITRQRALLRPVGQNVTVCACMRCGMYERARRGFHVFVLIAALFLGAVCMCTPCGWDVSSHQAFADEVSADNASTAGTSTADNAGTAGNNDSTNNAAASPRSASASSSATAASSSPSVTKVASGSFFTTVYNDRNGLPTSESNVVVQTSDGFIWQGSYGGLVRYDGTNFENYSEAEAIPTYSIRSLMESSDGRLWVGTNDRGIYIYDGATFTPVEVDDAFTQCLYMVELADGRVAAGGHSGLVFLSTESDGTVSAACCTDAAVDGKSVYSIGQDAHGRLWLAMDDGVAVVENDHVVASIASSDIFNGADVYSVCADAKGDIYIGSTGGVLVKVAASEQANLNADELEITRLDVGAGTHNNLIAQEDGSLLVCGTEGFCIVYENEKMIALDSSQQAVSVNWACVDAQGDLWLASSSTGLVKYAKSFFAKPQTSDGSLDEASVNAVAQREVDGEITYYLACDNGVLAYDSTWNCLECALSDETAGERVRSCIVDASGRVWVAVFSEGGVLCYDPAADEVTAYRETDGLTNDAARCLLEMSDGSIAVGAKDGVSIIRDDAVVAAYAAEEGLTNSVVLCLAEGAQGQLYAGTDGGGIFEIHDGTVTEHFHNNGLEDGVVLRMLCYEGADAGADAGASAGADAGASADASASASSSASADAGADTSSDAGATTSTAQAGIFVSAGSDLYFWGEGDTEFTLLDNFDKGAGSIQDIFLIGDTLMLTQNAGVVQVDCATLLSGQQTPTSLYSFDQGLTSSLSANTWGCVTEAGNVLLPTRQGVEIFSPATSDAALPQGAITHVSTESGEFPATNEVAIPSSTQRLVIDFAALNYGNNPSCRVYYQLVGFDAAEQLLDSDTFSGEMAYTNLPGGSYTFTVRVTQADDLQNGEVYEITVKKDKLITEFLLFWLALAALAVVASVFVTNAIGRRRMRKVQESREQYRQILEQALKTFANSIDAKDPYTRGHSYHVALYSRELARRMGMSEEEQEQIYYKALLHDIGKIGVPDSVLKKPGRLTAEERVIIEQHVDTGARILKDFTALEGIADGAQYHHERYDGKGYTQKAMGENIPLEARIIAVADSFDAMSTDRCYRDALPNEVIREELVKGAGGQFDPKISTLMVDMIDEGVVPIRDELNVSRAQLQAEAEAEEAQREEEAQAEPRALRHEETLEAERVD